MKFLKKQLLLFIILCSFVSIDSFAQEEADVEIIATNNDLQENIDQDILSAVDYLFKYLVVLIDFDCYQDVIIVHADFYKDKDRKVEEIVLNYVRHPEESAKMLEFLIKKYFDANGQAMITKILTMCEVEVDKTIVETLTPVMEKIITKKISQLLHASILSKSKKLNEFLVE